MPFAMTFELSPMGEIGSVEPCDLPGHDAVQEGGAFIQTGVPTERDQIKMGQRLLGFDGHPVIGDPQQPVPLSRIAQRDVARRRSGTVAGFERNHTQPDFTRDGAKPQGKIEYFLR